jgi:glycosyltransferase involved in cell wall biosynthesis
MFLLENTLKQFRLCEEFKMKIVQINTFPYKATGHIMLNIHKALVEEGHESYVCWGRGRASENEHEIVITDDLGVKLHGIYTRLLDKTGFGSKAATIKLLSRLDEIQPDIIHLHNIHGYYLNIEMLFDYIRKHDIKVVWTLHDCWAFTGHCAYFDMFGCEKWKTGCYDCERIKAYPKSFTDNSQDNWNRKKKLFSYENMVLVTPSIWLKNKMAESFFKSIPTIVINNGIDLDSFFPKTGMVNNEISKKKIVLGVASEWREEKGLYDFIKLSKQLPNNYVVVMIGTDKKIDKLLPSSIISIHRTQSIQELSEYYSLADVFVNLTKEDNFPTVNIEALACGTPVLTYNTGGSPEIIDSTCGLVIEKNNISMMTEAVVNVCEHKSYSAQACRERALSYTKEVMINKYINLYERINK